MFTIAIVGRPNVGKSALFNRIIGSRQSIVEDIEGVTRDRLYGEAELFGKKVRFIDTGGIDSKEGIAYSREIREQARLAIEEADLIIFVLDARVGATLQDEEVASMLQKQSKPVLLAANKVDQFGNDGLAANLYSLGFPDIFPLSAIHGRGVADLLEKALEYHFEKEKPKEKLPRVAIVGRPNVGKSTLMNYLFGGNRCIVSDEAGTTRDSVEELLRGNVFIDTAGIRRKKSEHDVIDKFAAIRTERAIEQSDLCILMLDVHEGLTAQEKGIVSLIEEKGKGCIIFLNKWDEVHDFRMEHAIQALRMGHAFLAHVPIIVGSAKTGRSVEELLREIPHVYENLGKRVTTGMLNTFLEEAIQLNHPPMLQGKRLRIYYLTQVGVFPPTFILFVNKTELLVENYRKYLVNQFRKEYDFAGCPIIFKLKAKKRELAAREA